jgi:UDP-N-acetyl-D-galactosamine dehydrogenase
MHDRAAMSDRERIAVVGIGYVGLPLAVALARHFDEVLGFDLDPARIADLRAGKDRTGEVDPEALRGSTLKLSDDPEALDGYTFFVITVPTPVDGARRPDLGPLSDACRTIAPRLRPGAVVVLESTVYPGVTEEFCGPILAEGSGLTPGGDFRLAYSPERINPGDREHRLETIVKVVSAEDDATLERVASVYGSVTDAGVFRATSIKVAEAAKVIENTQRDLNIALMNELAIIFDKLGISTRDVLAAAGTKWNFLTFEPGLVGGHCIGVDPYYLTARAEEAGYHPEVILAGRRINDGMGVYVAGRLVKLMLNSGKQLANGRVGVVGLAFKENISDLRNTRVIDIVRELQDYGVEVFVTDPLVEPEAAEREFAIKLVEPQALSELDALVLAVPHRLVMERYVDQLIDRIKPGGVVIDVKAALDRASIPKELIYWCL